MPVFEGLDIPAVERYPSHEGAAVLIEDDCAAVVQTLEQTGLLPSDAAPVNTSNLAKEISASYFAAANAIPQAMSLLSNALFAWAAANDDNFSECGHVVAAAMENLERCEAAHVAAKERADLRNNMVIAAIDLKYDAITLPLNAMLATLTSKLDAYNATKGSEEELTDPLETTQKSAIVPTYTTKLLSVVDALRDRMSSAPDPTTWTRHSIEAEAKTFLQYEKNRNDAKAVATVLLADANRGK